MCLIILDIVKDKENHEKHLPEYKDLFKEREECGKILNLFSKHKKEHVWNLEGK